MSVLESLAEILRPLHHVRFTPKADICSAQAYVRLVPIADISKKKDRPAAISQYSNRCFDQAANGPVHGVSARSVCDVLAGLIKEAASIGGLNTPTLPTNYLPRAKLSFCMTRAITEKPRAIAIVTVQKVSHMG
jgi:hypothetical protein